MSLVGSIKNPRISIKCVCPSCGLKMASDWKTPRIEQSPQISTSKRCDTDTEHIYVKKGYSNYHVSIFLLFLCTHGQKHIEPKTLWRRCSTRLASCGGLAHPVAGGKESLRNCHFSRMHSSLMWAEEYHYKKLNSIFNVGTHHVTTFSTGCSFQNFRTYLIFYWPKPHFCFLHSFMWLHVNKDREFLCPGWIQV